MSAQPRSKLHRIIIFSGIEWDAHCSSGRRFQHGLDAVRDGDVGAGYAGPARMQHVTNAHKTTAHHATNLLRVTLAPRAMSSFTTTSNPLDAATCCTAQESAQAPTLTKRNQPRRTSAVFPLASATTTLAPESSNFLTMLIWSQPPVCVSEPTQHSATRSTAARTWPPFAALCSGVAPVPFAAINPAPLLMSKVTTVSTPLEQSTAVS